MTVHHFVRPFPYVHVAVYFLLILLLSSRSNSPLPIPQITSSPFTIFAPRTWHPISTTTSTTTSAATQLTNSSPNPPDKPYTVAIQTDPITYARLPYIPARDSPLVDPGVARANCAPSTERPNGTEDWTRQHPDKTVVEQHAAYWDRDGDGIIWPLDTYRECRDYGWNPILSFLAMFIININFSYPTAPGILPDPFIRIWVKRLYKDKHGSDSMSYDNEGRFRSQQFEDFFAKYDRNNKGGLDVWDLLAAHKGQRLAFDFFGWSASFFEWLATYLLMWLEDGVLRKEDVRGVLDGSIFQKKADEHAAKKKRGASGSSYGLKKKEY
ncbi:External alternative NAD(P)H-ubiquinone oxidoreductase B1, mitochondrial [Elsinoe australis]|uniref:External alternative NAD(P)H-ubiquinone oxidoreductase B1, mitochondrial n=1 Tax=Elsinoe australis TaxID=40998 RepID=A0A2P7ZQ53_9PEZI|nr:External alternative NAD(P)H-ubiquinone oxidoreductase B1, mitochondrial [Elsinoe australis]